MDKVTQAIERVFEERPTPQRPYKATLRDLFYLDSDNGGWKKYSDRGAALMRLDSKTLSGLRDFLQDKEEDTVYTFDGRLVDDWHQSLAETFYWMEVGWGSPGLIHDEEEQAFYTAEGELACSRDLVDLQYL